MNDVLRERLRTLYAAVKLGQLDFVLNSVDDDIEYISYSPIKVFPFLGHRRGKAAMSEVLRNAHLAFDFVSCEPVSIVIEADNAATIVFTALSIVRLADRFRGCWRTLCVSATARSPSCANSWIRSVPPNRRSAASSCERRSSARVYASKTRVTSQ
jgi:ketosteroid isomerase-like protein